MHRGGTHGSCVAARRNGRWVDVTIREPHSQRRSQTTKKADPNVCGSTLASQSMAPDQPGREIHEL
jgi:hypothetical protein